MVRAIASRMLKHIGCEVEGVADGTEAIRSFKKARATGMPFDAVILDLTIPGGMGGKEAVKRLKRIDSDIKVIVSSGFSNDPVMSDYRENGFDAIVSKPYGIDDMKRALRGVLRAKAANFS